MTFFTFSLQALVVCSTVELSCETIERIFCRVTLACALHEPIQCSFATSPHLMPLLRLEPSRTMIAALYCLFCSTWEQFVS